jgi:hypothetical protein
MAALKAPWNIVVFFFRLLYGFRAEGLGNVPAEGPFILVIREPGLPGVVVAAWITIRVRLKVLGRRQDKFMSFMQESLFVLPYFRKLLQTQELGRYGALLTHSTGPLALSLLDGYRVLREGGIVSLNPLGEGAWDGRPSPTGHSVAWLGLHSAAPVVPAVCSIGAYDIWPRWRMWPSLRGQLTLKIGRPFRLCESPQTSLSHQDLVGASAHLGAELERLCYGEKGVSGWMGQPRQHGLPVEQPLEIRTTANLAGLRQVRGKTIEPGGKQVALWKRGISQLLWRCPICCANDALIQKRRWLRSQVVYCQACETRWELYRIVGRDFRLKLVVGPTSLVGLEMALSQWYDEMKRDFQPMPIPISGLELMPGEETYLEAEPVTLLPYQPSTLFEGWTKRLAPRSQVPDRQELAGWASLGKGRCVLTSQRMVWQGPQGELDFEWASITAVYLWLVNTLGINHGTARYRMELEQEVGLKWLTYMGTLAQQAAERDGHKVTMSPF